MANNSDYISVEDDLSMAGFVVPIVEYFTNDLDKWREAKKVLEPICDIRHRMISLPETTHENVLEAARSKVLQAIGLVDSGVIAMIDLSVVNFMAFHGLPGILFPWFVEALGLYELVKIVRSRESGVSISSVFCLAKEGVEPVVFHTDVIGTVVPVRDSIHEKSIFSCFLPNGSLLTVSQMRFDEKRKFLPYIHVLGEVYNFLLSNKGDFKIVEVI